MRRFGKRLAADLGQRSGRHHLGVAAFLCLLELLLLVSVEVLVVHLLMAIAIFGQDLVDAAVRSDKPTTSPGAGPSV
ncbi:MULTISPECIES: hypothetical protein [unclassified Frankia]|uniref:hypothetical protein n=1 Tax=unclassified Frankia TaxID=2632575 RepID=UPI002118DF0D|nr:MULTISPECIES: hypothetical protein [unclassified Frankia]